jgi:hypothetical protein
VHHEHSVANSLQNFSASPEEKFGRLKEKMRSPSNFNFLNKFGPKKHYFCLCEWGYFFDFPRIRENMRGENNFYKVRILFGPFLFKVVQNSAADLLGRSTFYSALFDLCGRTIGQLATLMMKITYGCLTKQKLPIFFNLYFLFKGTK